MSCQEDVLKIGKKLEKMISNKAEDSAVALDLLTTLKKLPMTLEVLQKTRIGMTVNNFRKSTKNEEVITLSKSLIKIWKKLLSEGSSSSGSSGISRSSSVASNMSKEGDDSRDSGEASEDKKDKEAKASNSEDEKSVPTTAAQTFPSVAKDTGDPIRIKCREMLAKALEMSPLPDGALDANDLAASIEECIYLEFKNTDFKYKNRVRSRVSNLKDSKNPQLRENVLCGAIKAEQIAVMTSIEMANDQMKKLRAEYTKQAINDHQLSVTGGTVTDLLKCGKCQKRKCAYNQVQTRSADEPMTTFVLCLECGHRWKFC